VSSSSRVRPSVEPRPQRVALCLLLCEWASRLSQTSVFEFFFTIVLCLTLRTATNELSKLFATTRANLTRRTNHLQALMWLVPCYGIGRTNGFADHILNSKSFTNCTHWTTAIIPFRELLPSCEPYCAIRCGHIWWSVVPHAEKRTIYLLALLSCFLNRFRNFTRLTRSMTNPAFPSPTTTIAEKLKFFTTS